MKRILSLVALFVLFAVGLNAQVGNFSRIVLKVDPRTIASNGTGAAAVLTLSPVGTYVAITCNDPDGCAITMGESSIPDGMPVIIVNMSSNVVTFSDTSGVSELTGAASLGQYATLTLIYRSDRWVEVSRSSGSGAGTVTTTGAPASGNLAFFSGATSVTNGNLSGEVTTSGTGATTITNNAVTNARLRDSGALSVIGRSANSSGDPADISASAASDAVLRESGSTLGFGTLATGAIANAAVTYAKIQDVSAASRILGRGSSSGSGDVEEIQLGSGLSMSGTTITATGTVAANNGAPTNPQGRLTLTTGTPFMVSTVTAATTVYYTPAVGQYVPIYDGASWTMTLFAECSQTTTDSTKSPAAVTTNSNYDVFVWDDGGTIRCTRGPLWTSDTGRGTGAGTTELERIGGLLMNKVAITNGPNADRGVYVGSIRSNGSSQIDMVFGGSGGAGGEGTVLGLWNMYNRQLVNLANFDNTDSWNYTLATFRLKNAGASSELNKIKFLIGYRGDGISALNSQSVSNSSAGVTTLINIGLNSTSVVAGSMAFGRSPSANNVFSVTSQYVGMAPLGFNYVAPLEYSTASGTCTWFGDAGTAGEWDSIFTMQTMF